MNSRKLQELLKIIKMNEKRTFTSYCKFQIREKIRDFRLFTFVKQLHICTICTIVLLTHQKLQQNPPSLASFDNLCH